MKIDLSRITVGPRQREDLGDLAALAASIKEYGLLQPIILDRQNNLIAGYRRLSAHAMMGATQIEVVYQDQVTPIRAKRIELEENVRRHQLNWSEESKAIEEIHRMQMAEDPAWTRIKTGELLGVSERKVAMSLELAKAVDQHPDVAKAETQQGAMMRLGQIRQLEQRKISADVRQQAEASGMTPRTEATIICGDALASLRELPDNSADFIVSNPPYGVNIESVFIGDRTIYEDEEKEVVPLLRQVVKEIYRVLKPDRWFVWFYPTARLEEGKAILAEAGFRFQSVPCVWYKTNKFMSALSNPYQQFSSMYETFFWGRKGEPKFNKLRLGNVFAYDTPEHGDRVHPLQMPVDLWKEILSVGSVEGELVVEPFSGSGSCGVACVELARNYIGLELSPEYAERSRTLLSEARLAPPTTSDANVARETTLDPAAFKEAFAALNFKI